MPRSGILNTSDTGLGGQSMKLSKTMQCSGLLLIAAAPVLMLAPSDAALAADETVEEQPALEQVVVTATRRSTTVQTTPISITAVTADQLAARGITDSDSLVSSVPGIAVRNTGGPGEMELEVRGLNSQGGNSSMVGLYLGEIPLSTAAGSELGKNLMDVGLYDVQRVEVLRGPQGTLYGSSSMGGTIRVLPNAPQLNELSASTQEEVSGTASGGGFNHKENGMLNIPLGDTAALRGVSSSLRISCASRAGRMLTCPSPPSAFLASAT